METLGLQTSPSSVMLCLNDARSSKKASGKPLDPKGDVNEGIPQSWFEKHLLSNPTRVRVKVRKDKIYFSIKNKKIFVT